MKRFYMIIIFITFLLSLSNYTVYADEDNTNENLMKWKDGFIYANQFVDGNVEWWDVDSDYNLSAEEQNALKLAMPDRENIENRIRTDTTSIFIFLIAIGTALTVIVGGALGVGFLMSSAEDKAKIKETMLPYVVGMIVIFGAATIWLLVVKILGNMN